MKRSILAGLTILALFGVVENGLCQGYGGYSYMTPDATYGNYSYGTYEGGAGSYYGQAPGYGSPYNYGYGQDYGQQGAYGQNPGAYGYDQNAGTQGYGQYAPYNPQQQQRRRANTQAARPAARSQQQSDSPEVRSNTQVLPSSRPALQSVTAEPGSRSQEPLVKQEIYWDGAERSSDDSVQQQGQVPQQARVTPQQIAPSRPAARQQRNTATSGELQRPQRSRQNATTAPPEPASTSSGLRWGREEPSQATQSAPSAGAQGLKWGRQDKPAMIGSEPGLNATAQANSDSGAKKLQWGKSE